VSEGEQVEIFFFFSISDMLLTCLRAIFAIQKNLGGTVRKNNLRPNSNFSHAKVDMKAKKYTHFA
jgi:hypothetical protein